MNASYYQSEGPNAVNTGSSYQPHSSKPVGGYGSANTNGYQNQPMPSATNEVTGHGGIPNKQGQSTGAEGKGPDFICRSTSHLFVMIAQRDTDDQTVLDKLEKKFGGERFNNPDNNAKNQGMKSIAG